MCEARLALGTVASNALGLTAGGAYCDSDLVPTDCPYENIAAAVVAVTGGGFAKGGRLQSFDDGSLETVDATNALLQECLGKGVSNDDVCVLGVIRVFRAADRAIHASDQHPSAKSVLRVFLQKLTQKVPVNAAAALLVATRKSKTKNKCDSEALCVVVEIPDGEIPDGGDADEGKDDGEQLVTKKSGTFRNPFSRVKKKEEPKASVPVSKSAVSKTVNLALSEFLLIAASEGFVLDSVGCGLLLDPSEGGSFCALRFIRPGYSIRWGVLGDVETLLEIEKENWKDEPDMRTKRTTIASRISQNPFGNLVVVADRSERRGGDLEHRVDLGETHVNLVGADLEETPIPSSTPTNVKGGVYFQRAESLAVASSFPWLAKEKARDVGRDGSERYALHLPNPASLFYLSAGDCCPYIAIYKTLTTFRLQNVKSHKNQPYAQLLDIHVSQDFSRCLGRAVGNELRAFVMNLSSVTPGVSGVCAVTRTRGYLRQATKTGESYESYVMSDFAKVRIPDPL